MAAPVVKAGTSRVGGDGDWLPEFFAILELIESDKTHVGQKQGADALAQLIDSLHGEPAAHLGAHMRGEDTDGHTDGLDALLGLLDDDDPEVTLQVVVCIGNLCSVRFDPEADQTKELLRGRNVVERVAMQLSRADSDMSVLYAAAALQNMTSDGKLATEAVDCGAVRELERVLRRLGPPPRAAGHDASSLEGMLYYYTSGALMNISESVAELAKQISEETRAKDATDGNVGGSSRRLLETARPTTARSH